MSSNNSTFSGDGSSPDSTGLVFDSQITAVNLGTDGNYYYQFQEVVLNPATGQYTTLTGGRFGSYDPSGPTGVNPAFEVNNLSITIGASPIYVQMRLRGMWYSNQAVYEFGATVSAATIASVPLLTGSGTYQHIALWGSTAGTLIDSPVTVDGSGVVQVGFSGAFYVSDSLTNWAQLRVTAYGGTDYAGLGGNANGGGQAALVFAASGGITYITAVGGFAVMSLVGGSYVITPGYTGGATGSTYTGGLLTGPSQATSNTAPALSGTDLSGSIGSWVDIVTLTGVVAGTYDFEADVRASLTVKTITANQTGHIDARIIGVTSSTVYAQSTIIASNIVRGHVEHTSSVCSQGTVLATENIKLQARAIATGGGTLTVYEARIESADGYGDTRLSVFPTW